MRFDPTSLVNEPVIVKEQSNLPAPAQVTFLADGKKGVRLGGDTYEIRVNSTWLDKASNGDDNLRQSLKIALVLHEISHVRYRSLATVRKQGIKPGTLSGWIFNVLEDARIEYKLSNDFPVAAKYFALILRKVDDMMEPLRENNEAAEAMRTLYIAARFGRVVGGTEEYLSLIMPRLAVVRWGTAAQAFSAAKEVARYISYGASRELDVKDSSVEIDVDALGIPTVDQLVQDINEEEALAVKRAVGAGKLSGDRGSGVEDPITEDEAFYINTVRSHGREIDSVAREFAEMFRRLKTNPAKEGDMNLSKVQEAYMASMLGEDGEYFHSYERVEPAFDIVVMRDTSGSTMKDFELYAQIVVILAEALSAFKKVRVAIADFGETAREVKGFNEHIRRGKIVPFAFGGTDLGAGLKMIAESKNYAWESRGRIVAIITDGQPNGWATVDDALRSEYYREVTYLPILVGYPDAWGMIGRFGDNAVVYKASQAPSALAKLLEKKRTN